MGEKERPSRSVNVYLPANGQEKWGRWRRAVDAGLSKLGTTWRAAPLRRMAQVLAGLLYLYCLFYIAWPYAKVFTGSLLADKERVPVELFLWLDPLTGLSTALAARQWNPAMWGALAILAAGIILPRCFCGYLCPLGTTIDLFDWLLGKLRHAPGRREIGRGRHLRYYLLTAVLASSLCGVLLSGYVSAIPVLTRGLLFTAGRLQLGLMKSWSQVGPAGAALYLSIFLFLLIFLLSLLTPRFWCRYVCPSGAIFSLANLLRLSQRRVEHTCTQCGRCRQVCPMDAIDDDFQTRPLECCFCQTCGGVCPVSAIDFVLLPGETPPASAPTSATAGEGTGGTVSRRALLLSTAGGAAAAFGTKRAPATAQLLRPPGSVKEEDFLALCIRCGECFKVCPGPVLHPSGLENGLMNLWTPIAVPASAGCHQDCNFCTQVCPSGAIVPLTIQQKRHTVMGLAVVDTQICLPHRGERDCKLCFDECTAAGYNAIEMRQIKLAVGDTPPPGVSEADWEQMGHSDAPFVNASACTGCGLCEYRCHSAMVRQRKLIATTAITIKPSGRT